MYILSKNSEAVILQKLGPFVFLKKLNICKIKEELFLSADYSYRIVK